MSLAIQRSYNPYNFSTLSLNAQSNNYNVNFTGIKVGQSVQSGKIFIKNNKYCQKVKELYKWARANKLKATEYGSYIYGGGALATGGVLHLLGYHTGGNLACGYGVISFVEGGGIFVIRKSREAISKILGRKK